MILYKFYISALTNPYIGNTKQEVFYANHLSGRQHYGL